jgi:hypothetical protein
MLSHDGGRTSTIVDPQTRTYWQHGRVAAKTRTLVTKVFGVTRKPPPIAVNGLVVEPLREEDGGTILGHPTRLHRFRIHFDVNTWPLFGTREGAPPTVTAQDATDEIWIAPELPEDATARRLLLATGFAETDAALARALASAPGLPLRRTRHQKSVSGGMTLSDITNTVEVRAISFETVPASSFEPPAGYRKVRWEDTLPGRARSLEPPREP